MPHTQALRVRACASAIAALCAVLAAPAFAQTAPPQQAAGNQNPAATSEAAKPAGGDQVLRLDPFEVKTETDHGYSALNSNSVTRFNTEMSKVPMSADIFDQTFIKDVAATTVEGLIQAYSGGSGMGSPINGSGFTNQPGDRAGNVYLNLRGQITPAMQRDGFMPVGAFGNPGSTGVNTTSDFDLERVEVINGPQTVLYGGGGSGGVINVVSKQAEFGKAPYGSFEFQLDQYGSKLGQFDYGMGNDRIAVRVAAIDQSISTRRTNIGGDIKGQYLQVAVQLPGNTTIRALTEGTSYMRIIPGTPTLTATGDPRSGFNVHYLLATNQAGATNPVTGAAYPAGALDNGFLNWTNVDSYLGQMEFDPVINTYSTIAVETKWSSWLTTQVGAGYDSYKEDRENPGGTLFAPGASGNTLSGWAEGVTPSDTRQPAETGGFRVSAFTNNQWLDGKAHSQSILGWDYIRTDDSQIAYQWVQADANFNPVVTAGQAAPGYTAMPRLEWAVDRGPIEYPFFYTNANRASVGGVNYVKVLQNPVNLAARTPANPAGTVSTSGNYITVRIYDVGYYAVNYTQWLDDKFDTLFGVRWSHSDEFRIQQNPGPFYDPHGNKLTFNAGVDYNVAEIFHPYVSFSDSYTPPFLANATDPYNAAPPIAHGIGWEVGLKVNTADTRLSGTLSYYHNNTKNAPYQISSTITSDINPAGLNGGGGGSFVQEDITAHGVQAVITANPTPNWRMRLSAAWSAGTLGTTHVYKQLYNDQFYANSAGTVTYSDGTPVYVLPTFNAKTPAVTASTPGAVPLTIAMMSTPSSTYYANPTAVNGLISSNSNAAAVLKAANPNPGGTGTALTGALNLPISAYQLNPALTGITPPGTIVGAIAGQQTTGYPVYSADFTSLYTFSSGWPKGFSIGGSVTAQWKYKQYYYFPVAVTSATALTTQPVLFSLPSGAQFSLITGYQWKYRHLTLSSQLNITNLFNHYAIQLVPNGSTGFSVPSAVNAVWTAQPRFYEWTNTISF